MGQNTKIQWTDVSWNIARGCHKVDGDCKFCYMYRGSLNNTRYDPLQVVRTKTVFDLPLKLAIPSKIFTCSLTDFFLPEIDSYRMEAWDIIRRCPQHIFQILTKRPERIAANLPPYWEEIKARCWMGTSVGSPKGFQRMVDLSMVDNLGIKFLSLEPLHEEIVLSEAMVKIRNVDFHVLPAFDWIVVGGESGNETGKYLYRPCELSWIERIVKDCKINSIPVFVKQLGTHLAKELKLKDRHGGEIDEFPEHLKIRQFPK